MEKLNLDQFVLIQPVINQKLILENSCIEILYRFDNCINEESG